MRTFNVTVNGRIHVIRAHSFLRPGEALTDKWLLVDEHGKVVWSFAKPDVTACVEAVRARTV